jgi:ATP-binding cassette, subfamily B, bacterial
VTDGFNIREISWPMARAGDAMQALARHARLPCRPVALPQPAEAITDREGSIAWMESTSASIGLQVENRLLSYAAMPELGAMGPALVEIRAGGEFRLLAVACSRKGRLLLLGPRLSTVRISAAALRSLIAVPLEKTLGANWNPIFDEADLHASSREKVLRCVFEDRLGEIPVAQVWCLRLPPAAGLLAQARRAGLAKTLAAFIATSFLEYGLWLVSWVLMARWALEGQFDSGWLFGWTLLLLTIIPIHMFSRQWQAKLAVSGSWLLMRQLLEGAFRLRHEEVRYQGVGQLLGRVLDAETLQSLALMGGTTGVLAVIQLAIAAGLLAFVGAGLLACVLTGWVALSAALAWFYYRRRRDWTTSRVRLTQDIVERIIGHRTRLAQQPPERWHEGEDESLAHYLECSERVDWLSAACMGWFARGWLIAAVAALAPGIVDRTIPPGTLAAEVGVVMLAYSALRSLSLSLAGLSGAAIAAERVRGLLDSARRTASSGDPAVALAVANRGGRFLGGRLLEVRDVTFRYPHRAVDAVRNHSIEIEEGDRVLLEGASGGGKSTFVALVSGVRTPDSGVLSLRGIDRRTLGEREWRRRVAAVPQFQENYIFSESLAFNVLLGRGWPPAPEDLADAETVCRELGLGPLLDHMPAGLMQVVGDSGWQLSNGEKSRVFLARALLQRASVLVLDETFASLDPQTSRQAVECVLRRAPALVCVAHV